jgi:hypothetical protein
MAADLASQPSSGVLVQLRGDTHILNFGFYASPEQSLLFDIVDFDETYPGPFEWDLKRLPPYGQKGDPLLQKRIKEFTEMPTAPWTHQNQRVAEVQHQTHDVK